MLSKKRPDIENEMDEIQRASQDLSRDEDINISVEKIVKSFENSEEERLSNDIWSKLENTESNEIQKGDIRSVMNIAKKYDKTDPKKLIKILKSGDYERPLILNFGDRYILVAGNTRLSTAAAMGINPKVFIGRIKTMKIEKNMIKGGLADNKTLTQIAKKHSTSKNFQQVLDTLKQQLSMGIKVEMEHTNDKSKAKEVAMDHLYEDPKYYTKLKKVETQEVTDSGSSGAFSAPMSTSTKPIKKINNTKDYNKKGEFTEATTSDVSASGQYDTPFGGGPKGRRNPLKIDGPKSIKNSRAVKDKNFPKWGGPDAVFVKIKEKCKKFPYCNQGIDAIELLEMDELNVAITETSKKFGIPKKEIEKMVLNEINKIFI
jgi:hypothetical protein